MRLPKRRIVRLLLSASASVFVGVRLSADTATFSGNQANGIRSSRDFSSSVTELDILLLDAWIHPYDTGPAIEFYRQAANGGNHAAGSGGHGAYGVNIGIDADVGLYGIETAGGSGIYAASLGGNGGNGGDGALFVPAGNGGWGRPGGIVSVYLNATNGGRWPPPVIISNANNRGIYALSKGGKGGNGGDGYVGGTAGAGGGGGYGGTVDLFANAGVKTQGSEGHGLYAASLGGASGKAGSFYGVIGGGGDAGTSGKGGIVTVESRGGIETAGFDSHGILAQSIGGFAPGSGGGGGLVAWGGDDGASGDGNRVTIDNYGAITTLAANSYAIFGQSVGGGGGNAGSTGGLVAIGGGGSAGGSAEAVSISNYSRLLTFADNSLGIAAQSIGGGGGAGAASGGQFVVGGKGGKGGSGGHINILSTGSISTTGEASDAIFAQSIGGGGGRAKASGGNWTIGGSGGDGGSAGNVTVDNSSAVLTSGPDASAILAQSIGGGGGRGASVGGLAAVGGKGGGGGNGGSLSINNSGILNTRADGAVAVIAQSIGGGGGIGGGSGGQYSIGGSGGRGGAGGPVTIENAGTITTLGQQADAIIAQSIGGGGGRGRTSGGYFNVGGAGGDGGSGGDVTVANVASLFTTGFESYGAYAQSAGGGGGRGGAVYGLSALASVGIGGSGAKAGHGGQVELDSAESYQISTAGDRSYALFAQSIGGGGGAGGRAAAAAGGVQANAAVAIGGTAGGGGSGGIVNLSSQSHLITQGRYAHALVAQSIGGGGGAGGHAIASSATVGVKKLAISLTAGIGGYGGWGGGGGEVTVNTFGDIATNSSNSAGIVAQSIGGGGGTGGNALSSAVVLDATALTETIGGSGGLGGFGGPINVHNNARIDTKGHSSYGLLAQSVGGGGGSGGTVVALKLDPVELLSQVNPSPADIIKFSVTFDTSLGGSGGSGGNGGALDISNNAPVNTLGIHAHGVVAQSIGGGGGDSGREYNCDFKVLPEVNVLQKVAGSIGLNTNITLGNTSGGWGGNGGVIEATNAASISTTGDFANGILAQSVGGGGGTAVAAVEDTYGLIAAAISPMTLKRSRAAAGGAGDVTVSSVRFPQISGSDNVQITTSGGFAHGILAQSVAGGGGFAGISERAGMSTLDGNSAASGVGFGGRSGLGTGFAGSAGGAGHSGVVTVNCADSGVLTSGYMSHGVFAQSVAGLGRAAAVTVNVMTANITANGVDSHGILAQSLGGAARGDISIEIYDAATVVRGGSGNAAGVYLDGGANNKLKNAGTVSASSGLAIFGTAGNDVIENLGTVTGNVILGAGSNSFTNQPGAILNPGQRVELGTSQQFANGGVLSPGGLGIITTTTLVGNLTQSPSGTLEIELAGANSFDRLIVEGGGYPSALTSLEGTLQVKYLNGFKPAAGASFDIVSVSIASLECKLSLARGMRVSSSVTAGSIVYLQPSCANGVLRLTAAKALSGDADLDGDVDADDYAILDASYHSQPHDFKYAGGDFNLDGAIDADDFFIIDFAVISRSSKTIAAARLVPVPEPAGFLLLVMAGLLASRRRSRQ